LFVPDGRVLQSNFTDLKTVFIEKLGFLAFPVTFIFGVFETIITSASTTTCALAPEGTFFGAHLNINLCSVSSLMTPTIFNGLLILARSAIVLSLVFALFRKYMEIIKEGRSTT